MYFTELRLVNFGQYAGEHRLDLRLPHDGVQAVTRPILLIGGTNGAGKTTLLEAVRLCLYGAAALGNGTKRADYQAHLVSRIHRQAGAPLAHTFASVEVSFEHTLHGATTCYSVRRMWQRKGQGVHETHHVWRDGKALNEQEQPWWEQFLHDLLPVGLADLFFFDGEKIQALADDADSTELGAAIRSLLGFDLLDRLRVDLAVYVTRQRRADDSDLERQLQALQAQRGNLDAAVEQTHSALGNLKARLDQKQGQIEATERELLRAGGGLANQREGLGQRADALRGEIKRLERLLVEQSMGLLPFATIPQLTSSLKQRLERDALVEQHVQVSTVADYFVEEFRRRMVWEDDWLRGVRPGVQQQQQLRENIIALANSIKSSLSDGEQNSLANEYVVHPLEQGERQQLIQWIDQATTLVPRLVGQLTTALERAIAELAHVERLLHDLPADEQLQPLVQRLAELQREAGRLEVQHHDQEQHLKQLRNERAKLKEQEEELYTRMLRGDDPGLRVELAERARRVLGRYEEALRQAKIQALEGRIVECFGHLSRKGRFIQRVQIDPQTFATTLFTSKGDALPKHQLSAGEKQLYAVALLWALRLVSGRNVPIIIDTPLGRLDQEHRLRLVQHYFPHASHQVILLATDSEIDEALYARLEGAVGRAYQLRYQPREAQVTITEGFFWDKQPDGAEHQAQGTVAAVTA
ncbi:MAG: DNA sulfur modification protein DndD [Chloroflexaceae bacterium]|nr:DNA sulfur modification protein DndD [Chloroflexaceae bacterium]